MSSKIWAAGMYCHKNLEIRGAGSLGRWSCTETFQRFDPLHRCWARQLLKLAAESAGSCAEANINLPADFYLDEDYPARG